jgi:AmmeMemoRadiSam system protein A
LSEKYYDNYSEEGSLYTQIARQSLESRVRGEGNFSGPADLPAEFYEPAAVFVTLKKRDALRGCIGTIYPQQKNLLEEIAANALSAGLRDPRFPPVSAGELQDLEYSVDVLTEPERVEDLSELDPLIYGIILRSGNRSGLLLPDLEGVDTVEMQMAITRQKAGIAQGESVEVFRFQVHRHY